MINAKNPIDVKISSRAISRFEVLHFLVQSVNGRLKSPSRIISVAKSSTGKFVRVEDTCFDMKETTSEVGME